MTLNIRRVVTGHDAQGRSTVLIDEPVSNQHSPRSAATYSVIWSTEDLPASNDDSEDASRKPLPTAIANGSAFRVVSFGTGEAPRNHRTGSIDYAVVISGEIDMVMETGTVHLKAGDVMVQRGTLHDCINNGSVPCVIAFALIGAKPVASGG